MKYNFSIPKITLVENLDDSAATPASRLLNCKSGNSVLNLYERHSNVLNGSEDLAMFFYVFSSFKEDPSTNLVFEKLLKNAIYSIDKYSSDSIIIFLYGLSNLKVALYLYNDFDIQAQEKLFAKLLHNVEDIDFRYYPTILYITNQILSSIPEITVLFNKLLVLAIPLIKAYDKEDLLVFLNYISDYTLLTFQEREIFIEHLTNMHLDNHEIAKIFFFLDNLKHYNPKITQRLKNLIEIEELGPNDAANVVHYLAQFESKRNEYRTYLHVLHKGINMISMASFHLVWEAMIYSKDDPKSFEKTIKLLKIATIKNENVKLEDFKGSEFVKLIGYLHDLRVNDMYFLEAVIEHMKSKLDLLSVDEIFQLGNNFFMFSPQFEEFYVQIHNKCVSKADKFNRNQREILEKRFNRVNHLFPESPFVSDHI